MASYRYPKYDFDQIVAEAVARIGQPLVETYVSAAARDFGLANPAAPSSAGRLRAGRAGAAARIAAGMMRRTGSSVPASCTAAGLPRMTPDPTTPQA